MVIMHNFYKRWKQECLMFFTFGWTCVAFWLWRWWTLPWRWLFLGCWVMPVKPHLIICDYVRWEFWVSSLSKISWHILTCFSCSSLRRWDTNLAGVCCVFRLSFRMLWLGPDIPDVVATSQLGFVFSSVLLINGCLGCLESSLLGHTCFEWQWHWKTCVVPVICCPEASLNISEASVVSSPI